MPKASQKNKENQQGQAAADGLTIQKLNEFKLTQLTEELDKYIQQSRQYEDQILYQTQLLKEQTQLAESAQQ